jgi:hypothetical protein
MTFTTRFYLRFDTPHGPRSLFVKDATPKEITKALRLAGADWLLRRIIEQAS